MKNTLTLGTPLFMCFNNIDRFYIEDGIDLPINIDNYIKEFDIKEVSISELKADGDEVSVSINRDNINFTVDDKASEMIIHVDYTKHQYPQSVIVSFDKDLLEEYLLSKSKEHNELGGIVKEKLSLINKFI